VVWCFRNEKIVKLACKHSQPAREERLASYGPSCIHHVT
jgi:hypothetical protein